MKFVSYFLLSLIVTSNLLLFPKQLSAQYTGTYTTGYTGAYTGAYVVPPGPFSHVYPFNKICAAVNDPRIVVHWTVASGATSYSITPQSNTRGWYPQINLGNVISYNYDVPAGFSPGEGFEFTSWAYGTVPPPASTTGGSSYYTQPPAPSWTIIPDCSPPGPFTFKQAPVSRCQGVSDPKIDISWNPSLNASYYTVTPQSNIRGWFLPPINVGNVTNYTYTIPAGVPANEQFEFTIWAYNALGQTPITNGSSFYVYGWTPVANCLTPQTTFTSGGQQYQRTVSSGTIINLDYSVSNSYACSIIGNSAWSLTPNPRNFTPASPWVSTNGSVPTNALNNNPPNPQSANPYVFTLSCDNTYLQSAGLGTSIYQSQKIFNVNVSPLVPPFVQTQQGDVHTNKDITVP